MNATEPTYFLYSGRLFHETALPALLAQLHRSAEAASSTPQPRREDPGPEGPEGEPVGEDEDEDEREGEPGEEKVKSQRENADESTTESKPVPGPGMPVVPEHGAPDANPIDPRVF